MAKENNSPRLLLSGIRQLRIEFTSEVFFRREWVYTW